MSLLAGSLSGIPQGYENYNQAVAAQQQAVYNAPVQDKRKLEIILDQLRGLLDRIHLTNSTLGSLSDRVLGSLPTAANGIGPCPPHCCILDEIGGALESLNNATIGTSDHAARLSTLA